MTIDNRTSRSDVWDRPGDVSTPTHAPNTCRGYLERFFAPSASAPSKSSQPARTPVPGLIHWMPSFLVRP